MKNLQNLGFGYIFLALFLICYSMICVQIYAMAAGELFAFIGFLLVWLGRERTSTN